MIQRALLATLAVGIWARSGGDNPGSPNVPSPVVTAALTARYRVTFDATWSASTHPTEVLRVPHFSGLIGATHRDAQRFWEAGALSTEGIRAMAEMGRQTPLDQEVQAAIAAGGAQHLLSGGSFDLSPASVVLEFEISREHPLVTAGPRSSRATAQRCHANRSRASRPVRS